MGKHKERKPLWQVRMEGCNESGLFAREVEPRRFHFIEWTDMDACCGRDNLDYRYVVELNEVDLDAISEKTILSALHSCGWVPFKDADDEGWLQEGTNDVVHF